MIVDLLQYQPQIVQIIVTAFIVLNVVMFIAGLATYAERKISADIQQRIGPNRVGPFGLLQFIADGVKIVLKEDILPRNREKLGFILGPLLSLIGVFVVIPLLPFSSVLTLSKLNVGLIFVFAASSMVTLGIFVGGLSSRSKWSMLGGIRAAAQIVSYEVPASLSVLTVIIFSGSLGLSEIIYKQSFWPWDWFLFHNPFLFLSFFVFFISSMAEANRAPFDLPEAESELVSGYHTEYSGIRFAFYALAEYIEVFIFCGLATVLFLGGYKIPFEISSPVLKGIIEGFIFLSKTLVLYFLVIWVRWTLPRLRIDQLMTVCWKYLVPISLFSLLGAAMWSVVFDGKSIYQLLMGNL